MKIKNFQAVYPFEGYVIDAAVDALKRDPDAPMSTVVHPLPDEAADDPNRVKVVMDQAGRALYFSRSRIPYLRSDGQTPRFWQHVGLYAYRREFLQAVVNLPATPAELAKGLEQLRALEHGHPIHCAVIEGWHSVPVDVPEDIDRVEALLRARER